MRHGEDRFAGQAGVEIYWQAWLPDDGDPVKAVLVIAHGGGEHSARYGWVAEQLVAAGYAVYALDHRGHGRSQGGRVMFERWDYVLADLQTLIDRARSAHPDLPVFLFGHSLGGAISISYARRHEDELAGLALSGAVASLGVVSPVTRIAAKVLSRVAPGLGVFQVDATTLSKDPEVVRAYEQDPLVHHGKFPARTAAEISAVVERFPDDVPGLRLPLLVMHGLGDEIAPPEGSRMVHERAGSPDKTLKLYDGLLHEILNEPERDQVAADLLDWLEARVVAGQPA
jgi:alpha-beta hydrolase superfamily lysophospholipase